MSGAGGQFCRLELLSSLHDGYRKVCRVSGRELLLIQAQGQVYLIENRCPHQGAPLHGASQQGDTIRCPRHGMTFSLASGACTTPGANCGSLIQHQPAYDGNTIGVLSNSI